MSEGRAVTRSRVGLCKSENALADAASKCRVLITSVLLWGVIFQAMIETGLENAL
jgi:hypothetical protein